MHYAAPTALQGSKELPDQLPCLLVTIFRLSPFRRPALIGLFKIAAGLSAVGASRSSGRERDGGGVCERANGYQHDHRGKNKLHAPLYIETRVTSNILSRELNIGDTLFRGRGRGRGRGREKRSTSTLENHVPYQGPLLPVIAGGNVPSGTTGKERQCVL